ncbi:hypothetical protein B0A48_17787 [Cryoendolithus antarcticus]|uniref:AAA+ ATPase domain-containing protein n=1 Tax=Cryoendolithus antarcticus TaxID=1507870 RepID=A0A1V8SAN8_9PEZI|nr:hypothetical protein B0A48_17787 [Cryoendolithus antarcticus]
MSAGAHGYQWLPMDFSRSVIQATAANTATAVATAPAASFASFATATSTATAVTAAPAASFATATATNNSTMAQSTTGLPLDFAATYQDYNARFERFMPADASGGLPHDVHREELAYSPLISTSVKLAVDKGDRMAEQEVEVKREANADLHDNAASLSIHDSDDSSEEEYESTDDEMDDASTDAKSFAASEIPVEAREAEPIDIKALVHKLMRMGTTRACVWEWTPELKEFLSLPEDHPLGKPVVKPFRKVADVGPAALAIAWLERHAYAYKQTWAACAKKAREWMESKRDVNAEVMIRGADRILSRLASLPNTAGGLRGKNSSQGHDTVVNRATTDSAGGHDIPAQIGRLLSIQDRKQGLWGRTPALREFLQLTDWQFNLTGQAKKNKYVMPTGMAVAWLEDNAVQHLSMWQDSVKKARVLLNSFGGRLSVPRASPEPPRQLRFPAPASITTAIKKTTSAATYPQYAMLGYNRETGRTDIQPRESIFLNTNSPCSTFICGSQGSGKSYTLAAMLEGCLLEGSRLGPMQQPLAGVLFQYDIDGGSTIAEAASLCSRGVKVQVLVSRTNYHKLKAMYEAKAGVHQNFMMVTPLLIQDNQLTTERMQRLMSVDETTGKSPLYMDVIMRILREMALDPSPFSLATFEKLVAVERFEPIQRNMLKLRMDLLKSFCASGAQAHRLAALDRADTPARDAISRHPPIPDCDVFDVKDGVLTIIDLSDPAVSAATACMLFDISLSILKERPRPAGMIVALDEAHKFLDKSAAASLFTDNLLTVIREQRHKGVRVVVATQEPTISEKFLDLCSMTIVHGFNSSDWFKALKVHLSGASDLLTTTAEQAALLKEIIALHQGESLVFSPTSYVHTAVENGQVVPRKLAGGVLRMQTRLREGDDGGRSIMAVQRI